MLYKYNPTSCNAVQVKRPCLCRLTRGVVYFCTSSTELQQCNAFPASVWHLSLFSQTVKSVRQTFWTVTTSRKSANKTHSHRFRQQGIYKNVNTYPFPSFMSAVERSDIVWTGPHDMTFLKLKLWLWVVLAFDTFSGTWPQVHKNVPPSCCPSQID